MTGSQSPSDVVDLLGIVAILDRANSCLLNMYAPRWQMDLLNPVNHKFAVPDCQIRNAPVDLSIHRSIS